VKTASPASATTTSVCVFSLALWNGRDHILKERLFGLTGNQGNHGEDVKECYYYLDSTPTHSYMKCLYKYPQAEFPYQQLLDVNRVRGRQDPEYELLDTGVFDHDRYFDVFAEYAKADSTTSSSASPWRIADRTQRRSICYPRCGSATRGPGRQPSKLGNLCSRRAAIQTATSRSMPITPAWAPII